MFMDIIIPKNTEKLTQNVYRTILKILYDNSSRFYYKNPDGAMEPINTSLYGFVKEYDRTHPFFDYYEEIIYMEKPEFLPEVPSRETEFYSFKDVISSVLFAIYTGETARANNIDLSNDDNVSADLMTRIEELIRPAIEKTVKDIDCEKMLLFIFPSGLTLPSMERVKRICRSNIENLAANTIIMSYGTNFPNRHGKNVVKFFEELPVGEKNVLSDIYINPVFTKCKSRVFRDEAYFVCAERLSCVIKETNTEKNVDPLEGRYMIESILKDIDFDSIIASYDREGVLNALGKCE